MNGSFCLFLFIAASSAFIINNSKGLLGNTLDELVIEALEYLRTELKKNDPFSLPQIPDQHLIDTDIDLLVSTSDVKISNGGDFTIDKVHNDIVNLRASFGITVPTAKISGNYKITGTASMRTVQGSGKFLLDVKNLLQQGSIQFDVINHSLQITNLTLDYDIESVQTTVDGLHIEGFTPEEITDLLNAQFMSYLKADKPFVTEKVASHVKDFANSLMAGKSLQEVVDWLKQVITSTPTLVV